MKKLLAFIAALTSAVFAEDGALLTLQVENIQTQAKWGVTPAHFSIHHGALRYDGGLSLPQTVVLTITAEDNFKSLNESYENLTAVATMSIAIFPSPSQKTIFIMGGFSGGSDRARQDIWSSTDSKKWTEESPPDWSGRRGLQVVKHNSVIYVLGGRDDDGSFNDVWSSTDGKNWSLATLSAGWTARSYHQAVVHNGSIYVIGGDDGWDKNDVWSSADGITWTEETPSAEWPVRQHYRVVSYRGKMYMMGGLADTVNKNDVWSSADGKTWSQETGGAEWSARYNHQAIVHNNKIYVLGGVAMDVDEIGGTWSSADGRTWEQTAEWPTNRYSHQTVLHDGLLYVLGGITNKGRDNDVWSSSDGGNWIEVTSDAEWPDRAGFGAVVFP